MNRFNIRVVGYMIYVLKQLYGNLRETFLPYRQYAVDPETWNSQYRQRKWDFLNSLDELHRYSLITGLCRKYTDKPSILDVGCGEGVLQRHLADSGYHKYTGIDLSSAAIEKASGRKTDKTFFICCNAEAFATEERFTTVIFNESLYYLKDPLRMINYGFSLLEKGGMLIISMFVTTKTMRIWRMIRRVRLQEYDSVKITNGKGVSWIIKGYKKE